MPDYYYYIRNTFIETIIKRERERERNIDRYYKHASILVGYYKMH
jgi:hypothetical protein